VSDNVVTLPVERPLRGWVCGCGGETWVLLADGRCVCDTCRCASAMIRVSLVEEPPPAA